MLQLTCRLWCLRLSSVDVEWYFPAPRRRMADVAAERNRCAHGNPKHCTGNTYPLPVARCRRRSGQYTKERSAARTHGKSAKRWGGRVSPTAAERRRRSPSRHPRAVSLAPSPTERDGERRSGLSGGALVARLERDGAMRASGARGTQSDACIRHALPHYGGAITVAFHSKKHVFINKTAIQKFLDPSIMLICKFSTFLIILG